jgi:hypothetical protein
MAALVLIDHDKGNYVIKLWEGKGVPGRQGEQQEEYIQQSFLINMFCHFSLW